jgi:hypothetical protein
MITTMWICIGIADLCIGAAFLLLDPIANAGASFAISLGMMMILSVIGSGFTAIENAIKDRK